MKTAKHIALTLMLVLLVATVVMGFVLLNRVMALLTPAAPQLSATESTAPSSSSSSVPATTTAPPTTVPPTVHHCDFVIKGDTIAPTCDMLGYTIYACTCGETDFQDFVDSYGHNFGDYTVIPATCSVDGWTERVCKNCKMTERINFTTAPHTFTEWEPGAYANQETRTCTSCGGTQVHSTVAGSTWEVMAIPMGTVSKHAHLKIEITSTKNSKVIDHHLYVHSANTDIHYDYVDKELLVYYTYKGEAKVQAMASNSINLTLRSDGKPKAGEPWDVY